MKQMQLHNKTLLSRAHTHVIGNLAQLFHKIQFNKTRNETPNSVHSLSLVCCDYLFLALLCPANRNLAAVHDRCDKHCKLIHCREREDAAQHDFMLEGLPIDTMYKLKFKNL